MRKTLNALCLLMLFNAGCATANPDAQTSANVESTIFEVQVKEGLSAQDVRDSIKSVSAGMNFVTAAKFDIAEQMKKRDIDPQGVKEVFAVCNLSYGSEIILDHPEFSVFAPCRIALYEKNGQLFLAMARPTNDLKSIKNPTERARKSATEMEQKFIELITRASKGEI
ncbi:MAG TPA: DUF302 domain-containing protein [Methylotenera sp.]|nr:DUF302 domain-containing protein [Methylotenera sp.]HPH06375.1 DUF302 domain-containing protein [Methylotenera sp.]HPN00806.1 DUF302 domain-containing protein [Methylotenera sp.]